VPESPEVQRRITPLVRSLKPRPAALWEAVRRRDWRALDDFQFNPAVRRRALLRTIWITVAATAMVSAAFTVLVLSSSASTADRLAAAGDVLVGATLLLAAIAAVVAVLVYAVSTGTPDIQLRAQFHTAASNNPVFDVITRADNGDLYVDIETLGEVRLRNKSGYSAKNPAVIVRLHGMCFQHETFSAGGPEWVDIDFSGENLITSVQWDGGPTYSIHGNSIRRLPDLSLGYLRYIRESRVIPALTFEILADGYRKIIFLPVDFMIDGKSRFPREDGQASPEWM
jgi:hypothetical protein